MNWRFEDGGEAGPIGPRTRWEVEGLAEGDRGGHWLPVIVRLSEGGHVERLLRGREAGLRLPPHEGSLLRAQAAVGLRRSGATVQVFCQPSALQDLEGEVLQVGGPVAGWLGRGPDGGAGGRRIESAPAGQGPLGEDLARPRTATAPRPRPRGQPIMAVIDDGIGFLHQRFQTPGGRTRFLGVWLQAIRWQGARAGQDGLPGRVIEPAEIEDLIRLGDEARAYRIVNDEMVPPGGHRATERRAGHGTHVLDLAAGAGPGEEALGDCPLLAVQLPPGALAYTSGRRLDDKIVMALRWIVARALPPPGMPASPLIVTLSVGSFGGPLDGTGALEAQVAEAIEIYRLLSGGQEMRVVVAFGNARRTKAVARLALAPGESVEVDWRILPDDRTDSQLALRVPLGTGPGIAASLVPPGGLPRLDLPALPRRPAAWTLQTAGGDRLAAVFGTDEASHDGLLLAVEATAREDGQSAAPSGAWRVAVENRGAGSVEVSLQVERDDTPQGYRLRGRQSWLDHPDAWTWEGETGGWTGPGGPITRVGTATTLAGLRHGAVHLVAAGERLTGEATLVPTRYSAEGGPGGAACPTLLARSDDGRVRPGLRAAGILTGSTARMGGTSVAAPLVARALAGLAMDDRLGDSTGDEVDAAEIEALTGGPAHLPDPRAGRGTLSGPLP